MDTPSPHADTPVTLESVHTVYELLTRRMLEAMRVVNDSRAPTREPDPCNTDWASVVKQLAKQAKRRSKLFYRRVKHSLLSPPAQSTLPVATRKIQRILQRNTPWSEDAASLIRRVERLHDPPPPTLPELRSLAKAARKKSPGPDGVPAYLLYILPDSAFSVVHSCLVTCYESGTLPREWLVSETFCLFKGKGKWQDPDRWRPIAMSNSIYRLLMRWVHATLYPLISPHLHPHQFGGKQGHSPAQATQAFMHDIEQYDGLEAILAFDVYHAFDSPPKTPHPHSST